MNLVKKGTAHNSAATIIHTMNAINKVSGCIQTLFIVMGVEYRRCNVYPNNTYQVHVRVVAKYFTDAFRGHVILDPIRPQAALSPVFIQRV